MSDTTLPNYDAWKLASPFEDETNEVDCDEYPDCIGCPEEDCKGYRPEFDEDAGQDR